MKPLLACIAPILAAALSAATWTDVSSGLPPTPSNAVSIVISPTQSSTLYARASTPTGCCQLFKSSDGAASWKPVTSIVGVNSIVADPKSDATAYATTGRGIFKTTDGGTSWTKAGNGLDNGFVMTLVIDPLSPSNLYANTGRAIYKSTDGGADWNVLDTGVPSNSFITSLVLDPTNPSRLYLVAGFPQPGGPSVVHLLRTSDAGETWTAADGTFPASSTITTLTISTTAPSVLLSTTPPGPTGTTILKSLDGGDSWTAVNLGLPSGLGVESIVIDPTDSSTIYLAVAFPFAEAGGILKSTDGGQTWITIKLDLPANTSIQSLSIDPTAPSTMYALSEGTILKSTDGGSSWRTRTTGLATLEVNALAAGPQDPAQVYAGTGAGIFHSAAAGASWDKLFEFHLYLSSQSTPLPIGPFFPDGAPAYPISLALDSTNPNNLYVMTTRGNGCYFADNLLFKSTDGGATWTDRASPPTSGCILGGFFAISGGFKLIDPSDPNTLYVSESDDEDIDYGLLQSRNGGADWSMFATYPGGLDAGVWSLAIDPRASTTLYAGMDDVPIYSDSDNSVKPGPAGVWKSTDGGATWSSAGLSGLAVNLLLIDARQPDILYAATQGHYGTPSGFRGMFKSVDGGATWSEIDTGLDQLSASGIAVNSMVLDPSDSAVLYLGTSGAGVFKSSDGGAHWSAFNDGLSSLNVKTLAIAPGSTHTVYGGTSAGVFKVIDGQAPSSPPPVAARPAPQPAVQ